MKLGQLFLRKIIKSVGTECPILRLKCTKIDFGWGSAPDTTRELTALPGPSKWNKGGILLSEWGTERGKEERERKAGDGRGGEKKREERE